MDSFKVAVAIAILAFIAVAAWIQRGKPWIIKMSGLTRICTRCERPLPRPRPKRCEHCGERVISRHFP